MAKSHPLYDAANMAASEMNDLMSFIKDSEYGQFMSGPSRSTKRRHEIISQAPDDVRRLLDNGIPMELVEQLAREVRDA